MYRRLAPSRTYISIQSAIEILHQIQFRPIQIQHKKLKEKNTQHQGKYSINREKNSRYRQSLILILTKWANCFSWKDFIIQNPRIWHLNSRVCLKTLKPHNFTQELNIMKSPTPKSSLSKRGRISKSPLLIAVWKEF